MSNYTVLIAGGTGSRMGQDIPKQFINVRDKPVLVYTMEGFQRHPDVDGIVVVCVDGWHEVVWAYAHQFEIDKLMQVVNGGESGQESIWNGVSSLEDTACDGDTIVIHDGIRPLVENDVLTDVIALANEHGSAASSLPYNEQIFVVGDDGETTTEYIPRESLRRVSTPQAYRWPEIRDAYRQAFETGVGIGGSHYANTMWVSQERTLHLAKGSDRNIKLTTRDDLDMFRAWLDLEEVRWLK